MLRLKSDLVELCEAAIDNRLDTVQADWDERASLGVVLAAGGYPESYQKGDEITGLDAAVGEGLKVFHAGTASDNAAVLTSGGRVLCACALGDTVADAQKRAYELVNKISWKDMYYRTDIGYRAIDR